MLVSKAGFAYNQHELTEATAWPLCDVSVSLLAIVAFVSLLIPAIVIGAGVYSVRWLRRKLLPLFAQAKKYLALVQLYVNRASAAMVAPIIRTRAVAAQWGAWWNTLAGFVKEKN
jgi:hypothetical protein